MGFNLLARTCSCLGIYLIPRTGCWLKSGALARKFKESFGSHTEFLAVTPKICTKKTVDIKHENIFKVLNDVAADASELAEDVKLPL